MFSYELNDSISGENAEYILDLISVLDKNVCLEIRYVIHYSDDELTTKIEELDDVYAP